jgi:PEP-CTERM motif
LDDILSGKTVKLHSVFRVAEKSFGGKQLKGFGIHSSIFLFLALGSTVSAFGGGVTFTCDPSIAADGPSGLCNSLNTSIASLYNNTFSNANANIYIEFSNNGGLADSTTGFFNLVTYSTFRSALRSESTDPAKSFVPVIEPGIFGGDEVGLTSAVAEALGIATVAGGGSVLGITSGTNPADGSINGTSCTTYATTGSGCYNGIIQVNIPTDLQSEFNQGYTYRNLGGSTTGTTNNYDFFSVVEHEADEILGTSSCIDTTGNNNTSLQNPGNCVSAVDMFRYTSAGTRTFDTAGTSGYFSDDGGVTDYEGNTYNDQANGEDWADFSQSCTFVQDAVGCLNQSFDITSDGPGGTAGPEIAALSAVGFDLATPEPGTMGLLGIGLAAVGIVIYRRRCNQTFE